MTELIPSLSLDNLLSQRQAVLERIQEASRLLREAYTICQAAQLRFPNLGYHPEYGKEIRLEDGDKIAKAVDASAWHSLMHASGMRSFLDAAARAVGREDRRARRAAAHGCEHPGDLHWAV